MLCTDLFLRLCGIISLVSTCYEANVKAACDLKSRFHREKVEKSFRQQTILYEKWAWLKKKKKKSFCKIDKATEGKKSRGGFSGARTIFITRAVAHHKYLCLHKNINIKGKNLICINI